MKWDDSERASASASASAYACSAFDLHRRVYIYIYIYMSIYLCVCVYIYICLSGDWETDGPALKSSAATSIYIAHCINEYLWIKIFALASDVAANGFFFLLLLLLFLLFCFVFFSFVATVVRGSASSGVTRAATPTCSSLTSAFPPRPWGIQQGRGATRSGEAGGASHGIKRWESISIRCRE